MELRPYQREAIDATFAWVQANDGHGLIVIPTGGGKSLIMGTLIKEALENYPAGRALILAHRKELIQQNVRAVATAMPLGRIGVYSAGLKSRDTTSPVIVGGIQSVGRRPYELGPFDLILVDEAHLVPNEDSTLYRKFIDAALQLNPHVRFVGLTATPYRMGTGLLHRGADALFTDITYEANVRDLIEQGYLCRLISRATLVRMSTEGVAIRGGEFLAGALERAVDQEELTAKIVGELQQLCEGRQKILVFCAGVAHAEHVAEALHVAGITSTAVHGSLGAESRMMALEDFKIGRVRALTSVDVLTTGYDEPAIDAIALLRPTKSTGLYVQMVGRGLRRHPAKENTLVLDFAGNVARHGPIDSIEVKDGSTVGSSGAGDAPTKVCPVWECQAILHAAVRVCSECGHQFPEPEKPPILPQASLDPILSDEEAPVIWDDVGHVEYSKHTKASNPDSVTLRVDYYTGTWSRLASEWICLEHAGFAREKAERWWERRDPNGRPAPMSVYEALQLIDAAGGHYLLEPIAIATKKEGKFDRVVDYKFAGDRERSLGDLPRACWSCGAWSEVGKLCLTFNQTPPEDVQQEGCSFWVAESEVEIPF
jgi:DNA repair protein RadD